MELFPELTGLQLHCGVVTHAQLPPLSALLQALLAAQLVPQLVQEAGGEEGGEGDVVLCLHARARWLP